MALGQLLKQPFSVGKVNGILQKLFPKLAPLQLAKILSTPRVIHVTSVCSASTAATQRFQVITIDQHAPPSMLDRFVLNMVRAAAGSIVSTGRILRSEPRYSTNLQEPFREGLLQWRHNYLTKSHPPYAVLLSRSNPPISRQKYPAFFGITHTAPTIHVMGVDATDGNTMVHSIEQAMSSESELEPNTSHGYHPIVMEAGPLTTASLYSCSPIMVDLLVLSIYHGNRKVATSGSFASIDRVSSTMRMISQSQHGDWEFQLHSKDDERAT
jgi:hypothetical protein